MKRPHWTERKPRVKKYTLDRNETYDTCIQVHIDKFLKTLDSWKIVRYPDIAGGYNALSKLTNIPASNLYLTSGSEQGIKAIIETCTVSKINIPYPTFQLTEVYSELFGLKVKKLPYKYTNAGHPFFDIDIYSANKKGAMYIASPDTPTGFRYADSMIEKLCKEHPIVILDQAYCHHNMFYRGDRLVNKHPNLYIIRTFSKIGGAAGIRVGYVVSHKDNIDKLYEYRPMFEINSIACEYLKYINQDILLKSYNNISQGKALLCEWLKNKGCVIVNGSGNFILFEHNKEMASILDPIVDYKRVTIDNTEFMRITSPSKYWVKKIIEDAT